MEDDKRYYWLKLKKDFFKRHDIQVIEAMPNGKDYVLFYLKLLLESIDHEGNLRFSDTIPYNEEMLSVITNTNIDTVRSAMNVFHKLGMVDVLPNDTIYMTEVQKMLGSETRWAEKKRLYRGQKEDNVLTVSLPCPPDVRQEIEIEKELELDIEIEKEDSVFPSSKTIIDSFCTLCPRLPKITKLSEARKKAVRARINSGYDLNALFERAGKSDFLAGKNGRNWVATFDWIMADKNAAKIMDGNYDNAAGGPGARTSRAGTEEENQRAREDMERMRRLMKEMKRDDQSGRI